MSVCLKKTLHIDEKLLREAKSAAGAKTDTDTVRLGLEALIRRALVARPRKSHSLNYGTTTSVDG
jgi:Arc/MetJ family transcription regulator